MDFYQHYEKENLAQVAIPQYLLEKLLSMKAIHCNECRCLNTIAKNIVWQTLLNNSVELEG